MRIRWQGFELPTRVDVIDGAGTSTYAKFHAEPFERGFATTIGNGLRRVLLSSIQGAAVRSLRIQGANNEFTTVDGVLEDITHIILNIKRLRLRLHSDENVVIRLEKSGIGPITAADITPHQDIEIINQDLVIATMTKDVRFVLEMDVGPGRGFVPAEDQRIEGSPVGTIAIDSIYSPVQRVSFNVANCRLGKRTNYESLDLDVWTDGSITPELALVSATKILRKHLDPFVKYFEVGREGEAGVSDLVVEGDADKTALLGRQVGVLDLSVRTENALRAANVRSIADLVQMDEAEVTGIRNLGKIAAKELRKKLGDRGLTFGMRLAPKAAEA